MHSFLLKNKLGALWSVLDASMDQAFGDASPSTAAAILTLHFHAPLTGTGLSRILRLSQPATVRLLEKLVAAGLVSRERRKDGKEIDLALTSDGAARAKALVETRNAAMDNVLAPLTVEKRALLSDLLDEVLQSAPANRDDARFLCRFCDHGICDGPVCPIGCRARHIEETTRGRSS